MSQPAPTNWLLFCCSVEHNRGATAVGVSRVVDVVDFVDVVRYGMFFCGIRWFFRCGFKEL